MRTKSNRRKSTTSRYWAAIIAATLVAAFALPSPEPSPAEQYAIEILNQQREVAGRQPVAWSGVLSYTASRHTARQVAGRTFEHSSNLSADIRSASWQYQAGSWGFFENMAAGWTWGVMPADNGGQKYYVDALNAQLNGSPSHYKARMDPQAMRVGISYDFGHYHSPDSAFVTEHFGYNQPVALTGTIF